MVNLLSSSQENLSIEEATKGNVKKGMPKKKKFPRVKEVKLYVPEKIDIDKILAENPPEFKYHRDCFIYIFHIITAIVARLKDYDLNKNKGFTPINAKILQKRIRDYKEYLSYLIQNNILESDSHYLAGKKSKGFRFVSKYQSMLKPITINKWTLIKSMVYLHRQDDEVATEHFNFLKKWFNPKLNIDIRQATIWLTKQYEKDRKDVTVKYPEKKLNMRLKTALSIKDKNFTFGVDTTAGRLHTRLTQLKSELRKFITYDGQKLCNIDITNSQPFLLRALLNEELYIKNRIGEKILKYNDNYRKFAENTDHTDINNQYTTDTTTTLNIKYDYNPTMVVKKIREYADKEDVKLFIKIVTDGTFYEEFGIILSQQENINITDPKSLRKYAKTCTFGAVFSPNTAIAYKQEVKYFKEHFPNVYSIIETVKKGRKQHPTLACILQSFEAEIVLWNACTRINEEYPHIPLFTIHDSITTTESNAECVKMVLEEELEKALSEKPKLKIEKWE